MVVHLGSQPPALMFVIDANRDGLQALGVVLEPLGPDVVAGPVMGMDLQAGRGMLFPEAVAQVGVQDLLAEFLTPGLDQGIEGLLEPDSRQVTNRTTTGHHQAQSQRHCSSQVFQGLVLELIPGFRKSDDAAVPGFRLPEL